VLATRLLTFDDFALTTDAELAFEPHLADCLVTLATSS